MVREGYKGLQELKLGYRGNKRLQRITRGYSELQVACNALQEVTRN